MNPPRPGNQDEPDSPGLTNMAVRGLFKLPWPHNPVGKGAKTGPRPKAPRGTPRGRGGRGRIRRTQTPYNL